MENSIKMMAVGILMACLLPLAAQPQQEWKSTSTMQGTGSVYTPLVAPVGASSVAQQATTTESYNPAKAPGGPRRTEVAIGSDFLDGADANKSGDSPVGDALLPLSLMALAFCGVVYIRRKRLAKE